MDFVVGEQSYRAGKLNAFEQLDIVRKLAPVVGGLASVDLEDVKAGSLQTFQATLQAFADLPKNDLEYIIKLCLKHVTKLSAGNIYIPITTPDGDLMYDDLGMSELIMLCYYLVKANLANFTKGLPSASIKVLADLYSQSEALAKSSINK